MIEPKTLCPGSLNVEISIEELPKELNNLGYTSVRYSKRGTGASKGNHNRTGLNDLINDLDELVSYVKEHYPEQKLYLIGHSEGAMIATLYTKEHSVDGIILISGAGIGLKEALQIQNRYNNLYQNSYNNQRPGCFD